MKTSLSAALEDYLEAIDELQEGHGPVRVKDIAARLEVTMPSVTGALKALGDRGLVKHEKYGYVELTAQGRKIGQATRQRHGALVAFLREVLDVETEQAEQEACELEHALSAETLRRLLGMLEFVEKCPRGGSEWLGHMRGRWDQQPCDHNCRSCIQEIQPPRRRPFGGRHRHGQAPQPVVGQAVTLNQFCPGFKGRVRKVGGPGPIRRRLVEMGLTPGAEIEIRRVAPLGDPIEVIVRGYHLSLRKQEAAGIVVEPTVSEGSCQDGSEQGKA